MSSIMKGIVDEGEEVAVIYIDGKPSAKYAKKHEAERDAEFMRERFPKKKIEIKHEVRETEAKKGADGKRCWKGKRYAGTENGKDKCVPVKNEAANPAQQAAIAIAKKKKAKTNEGVIVGHDANDPEVAILGGAGTMSLSRLKKKAHAEALQLADDIANGKYNASSYNMKQLHNTLDTIVAAEKEMEKSYFGESSGQLKEGWKMGALGALAGSVLGHIGLPPGADGLAQLAGMIAGGYFGKDIGSVQDFIDRFTTNPADFKKRVKQAKAKKKAEKRQENIQRGQRFLTEKISQIDMIINAINNKMYKKAANIFNDEIYTEYDFLGLTNALFNITGNEEVVTPEMKYAKDVYHQFKSAPHDYSPEFIEALNNLKTYLTKRLHEKQVGEDYTGEFAAEKTSETNPYGGLKDKQHRGAISETPTDNPTGTSTEGGWRRTDNPALNEAQDEYYNVKELLDRVSNYFNQPGANKSGAVRVYNALRNWYRDETSEVVSRKELARTPNLGKKALEVIDLLYGIERNSPKSPYYFRDLSSQLADQFKAAIVKMDYDEADRILHKLRTAMTNIKKQSITHEDTAYAGGMGQGGNAGESYRKFTPKSAGTYKESAIMKGLRK